MAIQTPERRNSSPLAIPTAADRFEDLAKSSIAFFKRTLAIEIVLPGVGLLKKRRHCSDGEAVGIEICLHSAPR